MSRIGKLPIELPEGVQVTVADTLVTVKGPLGELVQNVDKRISVKEAEGSIIVSRFTDDIQDKTFHGLYRSLIFNMVEGVSKGYTKELELVGVGYRASNQGQVLELVLGYSHNIIMEIPEEIKLETATKRGTPPRITLKSHDKQLIGQVAAKIRSLRKPEPYKGKGVKFVDEVLRRKAGKAVAKT
ncbi:MAG TPA: 50S ribosomal protein L6 [Flavobacteriales bacterium]|nr:50S ribosomal protein L6 [Flavobacteriales bacterium]HIA05134.1 50S ribosomal protein L6 [Flavobacteriales bacterium]HIO67449.1 50S ribosomal protein L6 [Flavobacteriales bacterium]